MTTRSRRAAKYAAIGAAVAGAWAFGQHTTWAQSPAASPAVAYSGYLEDGGAPINGTRSIGLKLLNGTTQTCEVAPASTAVDLGWFTVALNQDCVSALRTYTNLSLQFVVDSTEFPPQRIGAVPYALRALEYNSGSRLRRVVIQAEDGAKQHDPLRWWDSQRGEECTFQGQGSTKRCLPATPTGGGPGCSVGGSLRWFPLNTADCNSCAAVTSGTSSCSTSAGPAQGEVQSSTTPKYVRSSTSTSGLATAVPRPYCFCCGTSCQELSYYGPGLDLDATEFVSATEMHE